MKPRGVNKYSGERSITIPKMHHGSTVAECEELLMAHPRDPLETSFSTATRCKVTQAGEGYMEGTAAAVIT